MTREKKMPRRAISLGDTALDLVSTQGDPLPLGPGFAVTANGLHIEGEPSFEQCASMGQLLPVAERCIQFALGDYINYMEDRWGEQSSQVIDYEGGWSEKTCAVYAWLARRITPDRRRMDRLTVRHHLLVAALAPSVQTKWLTKAAADGEDRPWTVQRLQSALKASEDMTEETFWVMVAASSEEDQVALQEAMQAEGRSCKALVRRKKA